MSLGRKRTAPSRIEKMHAVHVEGKRHTRTWTRLTFRIDIGAKAHRPDIEVVHRLRSKRLNEIDIRLDRFEAGFWCQTRYRFRPDTEHDRVACMWPVLPID